VIVFERPTPWRRRLGRAGFTGGQQQRLGDEILAGLGRLRVPVSYQGRGCFEETPGYV
jgi:hypothetical protein